jgi:hypothetical protein
MPGTMNTTNHAAENRRIQLRKWIHDHFGGSQSLFISSTNDGEKQINQGELSGLLGKKSFGEKRARRLEQQAKMPTNYLEEVTKPPQSLISEPRPDEPRREYQTAWPFTRVSLERLVELKRALGGHRGVEAMHDIDETLEITVVKWERRATAKKRTAA